MESISFVRCSSFKQLTSKTKYFGFSFLKNFYFLSDQKKNQFKSANMEFQFNIFKLCGLIGIAAILIGSCSASPKYETASKRWIIFELFIFQIQFKLNQLVTVLKSINVEQVNLNWTKIVANKLFWLLNGFDSLWIFQYLFCVFSIFHEY